MTGIYKISNKDNGKVYIGKSKDIMFLKFLFEIVGLLTFPKFGAILDTGNTK